MGGLAVASVRAGIWASAAAAMVVLAGCGPVGGGQSAGGGAADTPSPSASSPSQAAQSPISAPGPASPAGSSAPAGAGSVSALGCHDLVATAAVKAAVVDAYHKAEPYFVHIATAPHTFYYGQCGSVRYAATRFVLTSGATYQEQVGIQDDGSAMKYFTAPAAGAWTYVASGSFPPSSGGCAAIAQIPAALAAVWAGCPSG